MGTLSHENDIELSANGANAEKEKFEGAECAHVHKRITNLI